MASCVPDLKLDIFTIYNSCFESEIDTDCGKIMLLKLIFCESDKDGRFSYPWITDYDGFIKVVVFFYHLSIDIQIKNIFYTFCFIGTEFNSIKMIVQTKKYDKKSAIPTTVLIIVSLLDFNTWWIIFWKAFDYFVFRIENLLLLLLFSTYWISWVVFSCCCCVQIWILVACCPVSS